jgi:superfamily I DNA/RNA helicase
MATVHLLFGPPGTGKTTTCKNWVERAAYNFGARNVLVASFTRAAAAEIGGRLPDLPKRNVGTLHSICYRALDYPDLTEGREGEFGKLHPSFALTTHARRSKTDAGTDDAGEAGKSKIDEPFEQKKETRGDKLRSEMDLLRARRIPREKWSPRILPFAAAYEKWKEDAGLLDFTDLLETCLSDFESAPGNPAAIFFDEAQDASQLQADILQQWGRNAQRLILAGDDDQAIYFWAGADAKSFLDFPCEDIDKRYLRQSYRVPRAVHAVASRWVKRLHHREDKQYDPRDAEGFLRRCSANFKRPDEAVDLAERFAGEGKSVMLMAACSYMLGPLKALLRQRGLPFHNPWRVKRGDWNPLTSGAAADPPCLMPVDRMLSFLRPDHETWGADACLWQGRDVCAWASLLDTKGCLMHGAKSKLKLLKGDAGPFDWGTAEGLFRPDILNDLERLPFSSRKECTLALRWWLSRVSLKERSKYAYPARVQQARGGKALRDRPLITIGTGHSLKGSEADVAIVFPDLSAKGWEAWIIDPEGHDGIVRLFYVMLTRAREGLVICNGASPTCVNLTD